MIDPKENLNAVAGKGAEAPLLLQSSCYNTGGVINAASGRGAIVLLLSVASDNLSLPHNPLAWLGIQYPYHCTLGIHITIPWVSISPSITVEHLLTIDTAGTPHPSLEHQPPSPS